MLSEHGGELAGDRRIFGGGTGFCGDGHAILQQRYALALGFSSQLVGDAGSGTSARSSAGPASRQVTA